jgi:hypothetical protein
MEVKLHYDCKFRFVAIVLYSKQAPGSIEKVLVIHNCNGKNIAKNLEKIILILFDNLMIFY